MNKRIQELWSQAGGHYNSGNQHTWPEYTITDPEKFAELIVQECMNVLHDNELWNRHISHVLKEHFGVEQ